MATLHYVESNQNPEIIVENNEQLILYQAAAATFWPSKQEFSHCSVTSS